VTGSDRGEVTPIERNNHRCLHAFREGDHRCVGSTELQLGPGQDLDAGVVIVIVRVGRAYSGPTSTTASILAPLLGE
jgi:hypothetical protein